jgi:endosialidase-like protein
MNSLTQSKNATIVPVLIALTLACFALSPQARAVCQEGCDTGNRNTFLGNDALINNTTGYENTAVGTYAMGHNDTGSSDTAVGASALQHNHVGVGNTAVGFRALWLNNVNSNNTAIGANALGNNTGFENTALGTNAGVNLTDGVYNIDIGAEVVGVAGESNTIRIGNQGTQTATFIAGISGTPISDGVPIGVNASGQLGVKPSSARYKEAIQPMDKASEAILALKPVTFRYKRELDPEGIRQFGLVAEQVEKVDPDLVARDEQGKPYTVRYDAVNAMLLNEFLKEHREVQDLEANAVRQQKQIEALTAALQKVSAQLELSKSAPQTVLNNQ